MLWGTLTLFSCDEHLKFIEKNKGFCFAILTLETKSSGEWLIYYIPQITSKPQWKKQWPSDTETDKQWTEQRTQKQKEIKQPFNMKQCLHELIGPVDCFIYGFTKVILQRKQQNSVKQLRLLQDAREWSIHLTQIIRCHCYLYCCFGAGFRQRLTTFSSICIQLYGWDYKDLVEWVTAFSLRNSQHKN